LTLQDEQVRAQVGGNGTILADIFLEEVKILVINNIYIGWLIGKCRSYLAIVGK
jgi:hypothetical protein